MKQHLGYWWADDDEIFHKFSPVECERDIPFFLKQVSGRGTILQAGANAGLYPITLAAHFQKIITFEPDPMSWEALQANLKARDCLHRVEAHHAALSDAVGLGSLDNPEPWNRGATRYVPGPGSILSTTIDSLKVPKLDAIWLDVEGSELAALKGAVETIHRYGPTIITEENGNGARYGVGPNDIADWLSQFGYERTCGIGRDRYYERQHG